MWLICEIDIGKFSLVLDEVMVTDLRLSCGAAMAVGNGFGVFNLICGV
jgi:hypothetical protein